MANTKAWLYAILFLLVLAGVAAYGQMNCLDPRGHCLVLHGEQVIGFTDGPYDLIRVVHLDGTESLELDKFEHNGQWPEAWMHAVWEKSLPFAEPELPPQTALIEDDSTYEEPCAHAYEPCGAPDQRNILIAAAPQTGKKS